MQTPIVDAINQWINTLTLPGILSGFATVLLYVWRKELKIRKAFETAMTTLENIRDNHLHHIQESLDGIKAAQIDLAKQQAEGTKDIVAAINASKDALVAAFLVTKN